jgi:hypothetical protein
MKYAVIIIFLLGYLSSTVIFSSDNNRSLDLKDISVSGESELSICSNEILTSTPILLDEKCVFNKRKWNGKLVKIPTLIPQRVLNWGSNGKLGTSWRFSDNSCNEVFHKIFRRIKSVSKRIRLTALNTPHDLFHGHIYGDDERLVIFIHAKEYPIDIEPYKNQWQLPGESFSSRSKSYLNFRNFIWVSKNFHGLNKGHIYNYRQGFHACDKFYSPYVANVLNESVIAKKYGLELIGDFNIFNQNISRIKFSRQRRRTNKLTDWQKKQDYQIEKFSRRAQQKPQLYFQTNWQHR